MSMNYKKLAELIMTLLIVLFLGLYISGMTGYYKYSETKKSVLTEEAMKRFEEDIKEGKQIDVSNYLEETKNYNNIFSSLGLKASALIEKGFNKAMTSLFKGLSKIIKNEQNTSVKNKTMLY